MKSINLTPTSVAVPPITDQNSAPSLEQKVRDAVHTGLKMLSFAQDISKPDLSRLANSLSKQISQNMLVIKEGDSRAIATLLNAVFDPRNIEPLLVPVKIR
jgi:hypothetical protein